MSRGGVSIKLEIGKFYRFSVLGARNVSYYKYGEYKGYKQDGSILISKYDKQGSNYTFDRKSILYISEIRYISEILVD